MAKLRRRELLSHTGYLAIGGLAGLFLASCSQAATPTLSTRIATAVPSGSPGAAVSPTLPATAVPDSMPSPTPLRSATPIASPTAIMGFTATPATMLIQNCPTRRYPGTPRPEEPFSAEYTSYGRRLYSTAEQIRRTHLIVVATVRELLAARWNTVDGTRPATLHTRSDYTQQPPIISPCISK